VRVTVKLFAGFQKDRFAVRELEVPAGASIQGIVDDLRISAAEIGVVMVNGRHAQLEQLLAPDDVLAIFPVIGGG
jgi:molybdopterin converting factor small subunit